jgi:hypothetical protein
MDPQALANLAQLFNTVMAEVNRYKNSHSVYDPLRQREMGAAGRAEVDAHSAHSAAAWEDFESGPIPLLKEKTWEAAKKRMQYQMRERERLDLEKATTELADKDIQWFNERNSRGSSPSRSRFLERGPSQPILDK